MFGLSLPHVVFAQSPSRTLKVGVPAASDALPVASDDLPVASDGTAHYVGPKHSVKPIQYPMVP